MRFAHLAQPLTWPSRSPRPAACLAQSPAAPSGRLCSAPAVRSHGAQRPVACSRPACHGVQSPAARSRSLARSLCGTASPPVVARCAEPPATQSRRCRSRPPSWRPAACLMELRLALSRRCPKQSAATAPTASRPTAVAPRRPPRRSCRCVELSAVMAPSRPSCSAAGRPKPLASWSLPLSLAAVARNGPPSHAQPPAAHCRSAAPRHQWRRIPLRDYLNGEFGAGRTGVGSGCMSAWCADHG